MNRRDFLRAFGATAVVATAIVTLPSYPVASEVAYVAPFPEGDGLFIKLWHGEYKKICDISNMRRTTDFGIASNEIVGQSVVRKYISSSRHSINIEGHNPVNGWDAPHGRQEAYLIHAFGEYYEFNAICTGKHYTSGMIEDFTNIDLDFDVIGDVMVQAA